MSQISTAVPTAAAQLLHLDKRLGNFRLQDVCLSVPTGLITGFVGPNGAGKTSTIKCLLGMLHPDAGEVTVLGRAAGTPTEEIGIVLDAPAYVGEWTVDQVSRVVGNFYTTWDQGRFAELCVRFAVPGARKVKELSRGMAMKLQLAVALSHDTRLLVLDEPTSGLDPLARDDLLSLLQEYLLDERNAALFSTHLTTDLERVADNVALINDGRILHAEPKDDLLARYAMVRGGPSDLPGESRRLIHGLHVHPYGFEGLVAVDDLQHFGRGVEATPPSLDELVIHLSRKDAA
ncbi:MAG: ABC transporter ATP-binding protein [Propionicimonas sp.]|nr:ABC transporter ATP-binding protein [Propionicimonas sp.]